MEINIRIIHNHLRHEQTFTVDAFKDFLKNQPEVVLEAIEEMERQLKSNPSEENDEPRPFHPHI